MTRHGPWRMILLFVRNADLTNGASDVAEEVSELSRLAQQQQWTEEQLAFLNASKACVIGRAIPFPIRNRGDPEAACTWDCWRRATMLEPLAWDVLHNGIAGDFIEAGVYKGGISVHMEALLHAFYTLRGATAHAPRERVRQMWLADSFGGLPPSEAYNRQFAERGIAQATKIEYAGVRDWTPGRFASPLDAVKKRMSTCLSSPTHQPLPAMGTTKSCVGRATQEGRACKCPPRRATLSFHRYARGRERARRLRGEGGRG